MAKEPNFISHWDQLFENFQASSMEFYNAVEKAVAERSVPEAHWTRIEHKEGGLASANRQYLRMHRGKHAFDICAAPFGKAFFVSWWLTEPPLRFGFLYTMAIFFGVLILFNIAYAIGAAIGVIMWGLSYGVLLGGCFAFFGVPLMLWLIGTGMRNGVIVGESTVLAIPIIGWIYERIFAPTTYYSMDTAIMFEKSIHKAVLDVIDCMTADKGVRALTEFERKPVMKSMSTSA